MLPDAAAPVALETAGAVARVRLNRPHKLNALDRESLDLLDQIFTEIDGRADLRCVILYGAGRAFCAGADLETVAPIAHDSTQFGAFLDRWHEVFTGIAACGKPTIACVHGFAYAGGLELTQACDFLVIEQSAVLADQHAKLGLFPGGGSTQRLPRLVPLRVARWMLISGEPIDAATAERIGLANAVAADGGGMAEAERMASILVARSSSASRAIKRSIHGGLDLDLARGLRMEREIAVGHMAGKDAAEGLAAFAARRMPDFRALTPGPGDGT